jgi:arginyl-tRNA synthetase
LPNRLCDYLYELSKKFNKFYEDCPVLKAEDPLRTSRLILADLTAKSLKLGLSLLGISVLERMYNFLKLVKFPIQNVSDRQ